MYAVELHVQWNMMYRIINDSVLNKHNLVYMLLCIVELILISLFVAETLQWQHFSSLTAWENKQLMWPLYAVNNWWIRDVCVQMEPCLSGAVKSIFWGHCSSHSQGNMYRREWELRCSRNVDITMPLQRNSTQTQTS